MGGSVADWLACISYASLSSLQFIECRWSVRAQLHVTHLDRTIDRLQGRVDYRPDGAGPPTAIYMDRTDYQPDPDGGVGRRQYRVAGHNARPTDISHGLLEQPDGQRDICLVSLNLPSASETFRSRPRSLTLSLIPGKLFPTSNGS